MEESSHQPSDGSNKHPSNLSQLLSNKSNKRRSSFRCTFWHFGVTARLCYLLLALLFNSAPCQAGDGIIISQSDYLGLEAFKYALDDPKGFLRSWNDTGLGACSGAWAGINCVKGKVIAIHLPWRGLGGHVARKIGQLTALRKLSLHDNSIGGPIPSSIQFLPRLTGLYLFNNRFSGSIPPSIGNCLMLRTIDLSNNSLVGRIPSFIANSTRLYRLDLSYNSLSGTIPAGVTRSPSLTLLSLQHNNLSGSIPDTWGVTRNRTEVFQLQTLYLDHNSITGNIPACFSRLRMLKEISLSNNQLGGSIPEEIGMLPLLQTFDVSGNSIGGGFPGSLSNLASLVRLDLASNHLESQIPETIDGLKNLSVLSLRRNRFHGEIPIGLGNIPSLSQLDLSDNHLTGAIPESLGHLTNLTSFFVSNNNLKGAVPFLLSEKFNSSSFSGNIQLCGYSVSVPCPPSPPPSFPPTFSPLKPGQQKLSSKDIILIGAGGVLALLLLLCCVLLCCLIGIRTATGAATRDEKPVTASAIEVGSREDTDGKLVHFDGRLAFTAEDLLCAMAEIMGKSTYGTVYKTTLEDGNQVAVKRLREKLAKSQREFEKEVNVLGKIRHPNLLALRAYYLGPKGEKLLVFDFMPKGSLATFLHARGPDIRIDWPTRMNMAKGVTRGLCYLHHDMNMIHGSLTSSNVLLDDEEETNVKIADYGLSCLMTAATDSNEIATAGAVGYRAPELSKLKNANTKTDVYSLGVIILELLTGKSPGELVDGMDLPHWVASIVEEEWPNEVFDLELMRDTTVMMGDELLNTLKLALHCVDPSPVARPEAQQVLQQLEEIKPDIAAGSEGSANDGGSAASMINQK